jgi:hypothetical protein
VNGDISSYNLCINIIKSVAAVAESFSGMYFSDIESNFTAAGFDGLLRCLEFVPVAVPCAFKVVTSYKLEHIPAAFELFKEEEVVLVAECCTSCFLSNAHVSNVCLESCQEVLLYVARTWSLQLLNEDWDGIPTANTVGDCSSRFRWRRLWLLLNIFADSDRWASKYGEDVMYITQTIILLLDTSSVSHWRQRTRNTLPIELIHLSRSRSCVPALVVVTEASVSLLMQRIKRHCRIRSLILNSAISNGTEEWLEETLRLCEDSTQMTHLLDESIISVNDSSSPAQFIFVIAVECSLRKMRLSAALLIQSRLFTCLKCIFERLGSNMSERSITWICGCVDKLGSFFIDIRVAATAAEPNVVLQWSQALLALIASVGRQSCVRLFLSLTQYYLQLTEGLCLDTSDDTRLVRCRHLLASFCFQRIITLACSYESAAKRCKLEFLEALLRFVRVLIIKGYLSLDQFTYYECRSIAASSLTLLQRTLQGNYDEEITDEESIVSMKLSAFAVYTLALLTILEKAEDVFVQSCSIGSVGSGKEQLLQHTDQPVDDATIAWGTDVDDDTIDAAIAVNQDKIESGSDTSRYADFCAEAVTQWHAYMDEDEAYRLMGLINNCQKEIFAQSLHILDCGLTCTHIVMRTSRYLGLVGVVNSLSDFIFDNVDVEAVRCLLPALTDSYYCLYGIPLSTNPNLLTQSTNSNNYDTDARLGFSVVDNAGWSTLGLSLNEPIASSVLSLIMIYETHVRSPTGIPRSCIRSALHMLNQWVNVNTAVDSNYLHRMCTSETFFEYQISSCAENCTDYNTCTMPTASRIKTYLAQHLAKFPSLSVGMFDGDSSVRSNKGDGDAGSTPALSGLPEAQSQSHNRRLCQITALCSESLGIYPNQVECWVTCLNSRKSMNPSFLSCRHCCYLLFLTPVMLTVVTERFHNVGDEIAESILPSYLIFSAHKFTKI